ncbi:MAG: DUF3365 domain-containing protein [Planctomycetes bacterium]|nr:DUF3365 domain-containing protein [Planctomycetota bacterium]
MNLRKYFWITASIWSIFVLAILAWNLFHHKKELYDVALNQAQNVFQKDLLYRRWAAEHGGVYVPVTKETPPNPYLSDVKERDIVTLFGRKLTLVNPAYMTRQVHELGLAEYGLKGHITSLNPLRPENAPDDWERKALIALYDGKQAMFFGVYFHIID